MDIGTMNFYQFIPFQLPWPRFTVTKFTASKTAVFIFSHTSLQIRMKSDKELKQFKQNNPNSLWNKKYFIKGNNCCLPDCLYNPAVLTSILFVSSASSGVFMRLSEKMSKQSGRFTVVEVLRELALDTDSGVESFHEFEWKNVSV